MTLYLLFSDNQTIFIIFILMKNSLRPSLVDFSLINTRKLNMKSIAKRTIRKASCKKTNGNIISLIILVFAIGLLYARYDDKQKKCH